MLAYFTIDDVFFTQQRVGAIYPDPCYRSVLLELDDICPALLILLGVSLLFPLHSLTAHFESRFC